MTPLARAFGTPDPLPLNAGRGPRRAYHKAHGNITPEQKAKAEAASIEFHEKIAAQASIYGQQPYHTSAPADSTDSDSNSSSDSDDDSEEVQQRSNLEANSVGSEDGEDSDDDDDELMN